MKSFLFMEQANKFVSWLISYWNYKQNKNHDKYFSILEEISIRNVKINKTHLQENWFLIKFM